VTHKIIEVRNDTIQIEGRGKWFSARQIDKAGLAAAGERPGGKVGVSGILIALEGAQKPRVSSEIHQSVT